MEGKITKILKIIEKEDLTKKQEILLECVVKIGTPEWKKEVKDLWDRMEKIKK